MQDVAKALASTAT